MLLKSGLIFAPLLLGMVTLAIAGPLHAQCKVEWYFGIPCEELYKALVSQINKWATATSCATGGQKCLYKLQSANVHFISAKHTTPVAKYVDDLTFRLTSYDLHHHCHVSVRCPSLVLWMG
ncbi:uncharacterized protein LOC109074648 [Arapaima gigas]